MNNNRVIDDSFIMSPKNIEPNSYTGRRYKMSDNIQTIKEHLSSNEFLYIIGVDMIINGCKLDFEIKDTDLLELISHDHCTITSLCFYPSGDGTVLKYKITTKNLSEAYKYIDFILKPTIIKTLLTIKDIKDLDIEDNITCIIENEQEANRQGFCIIPYGSKYLRLLVKTPQIEQSEFETAISKLLKILLNLIMYYFGCILLIR